MQRNSCIGRRETIQSCSRRGERESSFASNQPSIVLRFDESDGRLMRWLSLSICSCAAMILRIGHFRVSSAELFFLLRAVRKFKLISRNRAFNRGYAEFVCWSETFFFMYTLLNPGASFYSIFLKEQ